MTEPLTTPKKLAWVTIPLLILMIFKGIILISISFVDFAEVVKYSSQISQKPLPPMNQEELSMLKWMIFTSLALDLIITQVTRSGLIAGKQWARISAIFLAFINMLFFLFPLGVLFAIAMLIGLFDRDVVLYINNRSKQDKLEEDNNKDNHQE